MAASIIPHHHHDHLGANLTKKSDDLKGFCALEEFAFLQKKNTETSPQTVLYLHSQDKKNHGIRPLCVLDLKGILILSRK